MFGYSIYFTIFFALGVLAFKLWDRGKSKKSVGALHDSNWLKPSADGTLVTQELSSQEIYDFSGYYVASLKGAFASPTPTRLERLSEVLAAPHNLHDQLWQDMTLRLSMTYDSYKIEYVALTKILSKNAEDPTQLYAALRLATGFPEAPAKLRRLAKEIQNSSKVRPALHAATTLRQKS